jgi:PTH1 family peptidyl-tRNA hydrolase
MTKTFLIFGLGNPGALYQQTRHNIGWEFVSWLEHQYQTSGWKTEKKLFAQISIFSNKDQKVIFGLPSLFMNETGRAIRQIQKYYKIPSRNIFLAHDDNDVDVGHFKFSFGKGSAGHKGIISAIKHLGSNNFYRVRIGIQPQKTKRTKAEDLVLKKFTPSEKKDINEQFTTIQKILETQLKKM